jgi:hypothetical protein
MTRERVNDDPDAERLAMLLDARLSPQDRERLLAELADNPEMIAILAGAADGLRTIEQSTVQRPSSDRRSLVDRLRSTPIWLAAAAAILVAILFGVWQIAPRATQADRVLALVERVEAQRDLPDDWYDPPWNRTRGPGNVFDRAATSTILGARAADLAFARHRAPDRAREIATAMGDLASGIPGSGPAVTAWEAAWQRLSDSAAVAGALGESRTVLEQLADPAYFALGVTLEGMRIGILSGDSETLASLAREFRMWTPPRETSDRVVAAIAALSDALEERGMAQQDGDRQLRAIDAVFLAVLQGPGSV